MGGEVSHTHWVPVIMLSESSLVAGVKDHQR